MERAEAARNEGGERQLPCPNHAIDSLLDEIDDYVAELKIDLNLGIAGREARQRGNDEVARQGGRGTGADEASDPASTPRGRSLGSLNLAQDGFAAIEVTQPSIRDG